MVGSVVPGGNHYGRFMTRTDRKVTDVRYTVAVNTAVIAKQFNDSSDSSGKRLDLTFCNPSFAISFSE